MTIARILFPLPLPEPFDYIVPDHLSVEPGCYVIAPLGAQKRIGIIVDCHEHAPDRTLKAVLDVLPTPPMGKAMRQFIDFCARYTVSPPGLVLSMALRSSQGLLPSPMRTVYHASGRLPERITTARRSVLAAAAQHPNLAASALAKRANVSAGVVKSLVDAGSLEATTEPVDTPFPIPDPNRPGVALTAEQSAAASQLRHHIAAKDFKPVLLDGVTGSGKTEVYFEAIAAIMQEDKTAQILVLLPEIALTEAVLSRFEMRFGTRPAAWHSGLSQPQRRRTWREVAHGRARIVAGARSALFLPYANLRLIIVDEEHDSSFKQEDGVTYHARDMAVMRAKLEQAMVILASATPALETVVNADTGRYRRIALAARPGLAQLPDVELVDLKVETPAKGEWLSPVLKSALVETFSRGEQSLLFMNRRGYAPLVICKACGERLKSPATESWLTEHRYSGRLICHLTGWSMPKPSHCPHCGARDSLMGVGPGVERIAEEVRILMPTAKIEIFSSDTTLNADDSRNLIDRMANSEIDILIGTQMAAKGHNFPNLTMVGVVDADSGLQGGDLRAGERTYQLLSQVAGRAGRAQRPGRALIQTYQIDNPAMVALVHGDRDGFLEIEKDVRESLDLPPYGRMAALIMSAPDLTTADKFSDIIGQAAPHGEQITVYGPAPAPIGVLRGRHRRRFLAISKKNVDLSAYMTKWANLIKVPNSVRISIDIDPYSFL